MIVEIFEIRETLKGLHNEILEILKNSYDEYLKFLFDELNDILSGFTAENSDNVLYWGWCGEGDLNDRVIWLFVRYRKFIMP